MKLIYLLVLVFTSTLAADSKYGSIDVAFLNGFFGKGDHYLPGVRAQFSGNISSAISISTQFSYLQSACKNCGTAADMRNEFQMTYQAFGLLGNWQKDFYSKGNWTQHFKVGVGPMYGIDKRVQSIIISSYTEGKGSDLDFITKEYLNAVPNSFLISFKEGNELILMQMQPSLEEELGGVIELTYSVGWKDLSLGILSALYLSPKGNTLTLAGLQLGHAF